MMLPLDRLLQLQGVAVARLTLTGDVVACNEPFRDAVRAASTAGWSAAACFLSPTFAELRERAEAGREPVHEGTVDIGAPDGAGLVMRASILRVGADLVFLGEVDRPAYERVTDEVMKLNAELSELQREQRRTIERLERTERELREALAQVKTLRGLLPICASCKKIKNDAGTWERLETYVERHSEAQLSHGVCKDCLAEQLAEADEA